VPVLLVPKGLLVLKDPKGLLVPKGLLGPQVRQARPARLPRWPN
jgi:hypothetical protein